MKGLSLTMAIGKWARPHIKAETYSARICLGFLAITIWTLDIEEFMLFLRDGSVRKSKN